MTGRILCHIPEYRPEVGNRQPRRLRIGDQRLDWLNEVLQMTKTKEAQTKQKRIENLTLRELDMVYSLVLVQDWPDSEIGRV